ncbi:hypothetical protein, partial [Herbaspirillum frisingense]|uniref:hypothetical protein n=1 Tax=Herbaspirillum frisingense TaxID=92645 RepID=UPI0039AF4D0E
MFKQKKPGKPACILPPVGLRMHTLCAAVMLTLGPALSMPAVAQVTNEAQVLASGTDSSSDTGSASTTGGTGGTGTADSTGGTGTTTASDTGTTTGDTGASTTGGTGTSTTGSAG